MKTKIKKWGNSLALRIPKYLASDVNLELNEWVNISIDKDSIIIKPVREKKYSLKNFLANISENNLHGEIDSGAPVGKEVW